jgi:hypothetical protein
MGFLKRKRKLTKESESGLSIRAIEAVNANDKWLYIAVAVEGMRRQGIEGPGTERAAELLWEQKYARK